MSAKIKIIFLIAIVLFIISPVVLADVRVENKTISVDLSPDKISDSTYLPLEELAENGFFELDRIDDNRYYVLVDDAYYSLESGKKNVKSNTGNRVLNNPPININGHFLIPVEFLRQRLNLRVRTLDSSRDNDIRSQSDNLRLRVYLDDDEYQDYEDLELRIEIMNTENKDINLHFNSSQKYNIYIKNRFGRIVYSWAENKFFTQARERIEIKSRDSLSFSEEIDLSKFNEGDYTVEVEILAENYDFETVVKEFEIDD